MTLQTAIALFDYIENGATLSHAIPFQFQAATDIVCSRILDGVETALTLGADYTVSGGLGSIGTVTKSNGGVAGTIFRIRRRTARAQTADYTPGDSFPAEVHEAALDKAMAIDQEQDASIGDLESRAVRVPVGETAVTLPIKSLRAGKYQAYGVNGDLVASEGTGADAGLRSDLAASGGAGLIGWLASGAGALVRSIRDKLRETVTFEDFGAVGNGVANDRAAVVAARIAALASGAEIRLLPGKNYYVGDTLTDISGVGIRAARGSRLSGSVDMQQDIRPVGDALRIDINSAGVRYTAWVAPERSFAQRRLRLTEGALKRATGQRIAPSVAGSLLFEQVAWPAGDAWTASAPASTTVDAWEANAAAGNIWFGAFRAARAGQTLRGTFEAGVYNRGLIVRWNGGYVVMYGSGTTCQVSVKNTGVALSTAALSWPGQADHPQWSLDNAELGIRVYDLTTVGFLVNGYEVYRATLAGIIHDVGFGIFSTGVAVTPAVSWITETIEDSFNGQQSLSFAVFGDSLSSPFASGPTSGFFTGAWADAFREAVDRSPQGVKVTGWTNWAVVGHNSANMTAQFDLHGVGVANYAVLLIGTNDVQGGSPLATSIGNLTYVLNGINAAGRKAVVVIPPLWLNADQGADGFASANAQNGAPLRAAFRSLALQNNALLVDLTQLTGQILATYYGDATLSDTAVRDRLHPTAFLYEAIGHEIASVVLGDIARKVTRRVPLLAVPAAWRRNGWTVTTEALWMEVSDSGLVRMFGIYDAGTKVNGTVIMNTPPSLRPATTRRFVVKSSGGTAVRLDWTNDGNIAINDMPGGDTWITFDGLAVQL